MVTKEPINGAYTQAEKIASALTRRISAGEFQAGERLGSEQVLADEFGTSRGTIRRALAILQESDLVKTKPGSGSYVSFHGESMADPRGWAATILELGLPTSTEILSVSLIPTPSKMETHCPDVEVYRIVRRRLLNGEILSLEIAIIPANERMKTIMEYGLLGGSIAKTLCATGMKPTNGYQNVSVGYLDAESAELMERDEGTHMIRSERTGFTAAGTLAEQVDSWLDPQHFSFHLTFDEE